MSARASERWSAHEGPKPVQESAVIPTLSLDTVSSQMKEIEPIPVILQYVNISKIQTIDRGRVQIDQQLLLSQTPSLQWTRNYPLVEFQTSSSESLS